MNTTTWKTMQPDAAKDTAKVFALKNAWWQIENIRREYGTLIPCAPAFQDELQTIIECLASFDAAHHNPPMNVTHPRTPLPADSEGRFTNSRVIGETLAAVRERKGNA